MKATSKSICFHCEKPYCGCCVQSSSISATAKFASWIALKKAPFKFPLPLLSLYFLHETKIECIYRVLLPNWLQWLIFTISPERRGYEKLLQPSVYPWRFPHKERSHIQDCNQTMCEKSDSGLFCRKEQGLIRHEWLWSSKIFWWV